MAGGLDVIFTTRRFALCLDDCGQPVVRPLAAVLPDVTEPPRSSPGASPDASPVRSAPGTLLLRGSHHA